MINNELYNIWIRMQISFTVIGMFIGSILSIILFPIAYWIFAISPDRIFEWQDNKMNFLKSKLK